MSEDILINVTPQTCGTSKGRNFEKAPLAYPPSLGGVSTPQIGLPSE
jgi:hypothetical protein